MCLQACLDVDYIYYHINATYQVLCVTQDMLDKCLKAFSHACFQECLHVYIQVWFTHRFTCVFESTFTKTMEESVHVI